MPNTKEGLSSLFSEIEGGKVGIGGQLWATWADGHSFRVNYDHDSKTHRSSATNSRNDIVRSPWTPRGYTTKTNWLLQTLSGNKIYYDI